MMENVLHEIQAACTQILECADRSLTYDLLVAADIDSPRMERFGADAVHLSAEMIRLLVRWYVAVDDEVRTGRRMGLMSSCMSDTRAVLQAIPVLHREDLRRIADSPPLATYWDARQPWRSSLLIMADRSGATPPSPPISPPPDSPVAPEESPPASPKTPEKPA